MKSCPTGTIGDHEGDWEDVREKDDCMGNMGPRQTGMQVMLGLRGPPAWQETQRFATLERP